MKKKYSPMSEKNEITKKRFSDSFKMAFPPTKTQSIESCNNQNLPKHMKELIQTDLY